MNKKLHYATVLTAVCAGAAFGVGGTYLLTRGEIERRETAKQRKALSIVLPGADAFSAVTSTDTPTMDVVTKGVGRGKTIGYAALGEAQGYQSKIKVMVGVRAGAETPTILGIQVVSQNETAGLGTRVEEIKTDKTWAKVLAGVFSGDKTDAAAVPSRPWFQEQFRDKTLGRLVVDKTPSTDKIQAVTGATISSRAVTLAVKRAVKKAQACLAVR